MHGYRDTALIIPVPKPLYGNVCCAIFCKIGFFVIEIPLSILLIVSEFGSFPGLIISTLSVKIKTFMVELIK